MEDRTGQMETGGVGTYEVMRQFYILKKLADEDQFFAGVSPTANRLISDLSSQRIREYRGDAGDVAFNKCWNPQGNTIDCVVQDLPLLVVSPRGELYIFNGREDDSHAYFQSIPASTFWAHNTLKNSEIDISHTEEWGPYTRFLDPIEIEPNQLVKAVFDPAGRPHVAAISKDSKSIYYSNDLKKTEVVFVSTSAVRDIDIAIVDNVAHVLASENDPGGRRIWDFSRTPEGGWNRILIGSSAGQFEAPPRNEINVARHSAGPSGHYTLPFAAVSWIESNGTLRFRRIGAVPFQLQIDALKKLVLYFVLSSMTVLAIFLTAEILISRKQPLSQRLAVGYLIALVIFLIAKDVYSWHLRNELFLAPDPYVILGSLGGLVAILYAFVSNFLKIVEALRKAASTSPT